MFKKINTPSGISASGIGTKLQICQAGSAVIKKQKLI